METQGCPNFLVSAWCFRLVKSAEAVGEFGKSAGRCKQVNIGAMPCTQFDNGKILDGLAKFLMGFLVLYSDVMLIISDNALLITTADLYYNNLVRLFVCLVE